MAQFNKLIARLGWDDLPSVPGVRYWRQMERDRDTDQIADNATDNLIHTETYI